LRHKIETLARIERLRKRMHEMAQWRLAVVVAEREKLSSAHAEMIEALGDGLMAFGPASVAGTRRLRGIEREMALADVTEKDLEQRTLEEGRLAKLADRCLGAAREALRGQVERRSLEELIEATLRCGSGPHKA